MKKLMICVLASIVIMGASGQSSDSTAASAANQSSEGAGGNKKLTTVLGVSVGMDMKQALEQLQERSKRFHGVPVIAAADNSMGLLLNLQMRNVRLGWDDNLEMIASIVQVSFFKGKVVQIAVKGDDDGITSRWQLFLCKILNTKRYDRRDFIGEGVMVNPIEHCKMDGKVMIIADAENWNAFMEEKSRLEEFFNSVPRKDQVLD